MTDIASTVEGGIRTKALMLAAPRGLAATLGPYLLLAVIAVPGLTLRLSTYPPPWLDEGIMTHAARVVVELGVFGTDTTAGLRPFDPIVSVGPSTIVPVALSFDLFGCGMLQGRLVVVGFTLLATFLLYRLASDLFGRAAGLFSVLLVLATPSIAGTGFLLSGRQVLGETPGLAWLLLGFHFWFRSWEDDRRSTAVLAGLAWGLSLLSKMQIGIALLPAISIIATARISRGRSDHWRELVAVGSVLALVGAWLLLGQVVTPPPIRRENAVLLLENIRANILTGFFAHRMTRATLVMSAVMIAGATASSLRLFSAPRPRLNTNRDWSEATVALFVVLSGVWSACVSAGWPRYFYLGFSLGLLLFGKLAWDGFQYLRLQMPWPELRRRGETLAVGGFSVLAVITNVAPAVTSADEPHAQEVAEFVQAEIPHDAVIESAEWEIDALGEHRRYHHPDSRYIFLAIHQFARDRRPFDLGYDGLEADPAYLIKGPFSDWTRLYDDEMIASNFIELKQIGPYRIYARAIEQQTRGRPPASDNGLSD